MSAGYAECAGCAGVCSDHAEDGRVAGERHSQPPTTHHTCITRTPCAACWPAGAGRACSARPKEFVHGSAAPIPPLPLPIFTACRAKPYETKYNFLFQLQQSDLPKSQYEGLFWPETRNRQNGSFLVNLVPKFSQLLPIQIILFKIQAADGNLLSAAYIP